MSLGMLQLIVLAIVIAGAAIWIVIGGKRADRARLSRFSSREDLSFDRLYEDHYKILGLDREKVRKALNDVAQALDIPATKLRPTDRFNVELAAERGWEFDDGVAVLSARVAKKGRRSAKAQGSPVETLDDYVRTIAAL